MNKEPNKEPNKALDDGEARVLSDEEMEGIVGGGDPLPSIRPEGLGWGTGSAGLATFGLTREQMAQLRK